MLPKEAQYLRRVRTIIGPNVETEKPSSIPTTAREFHTRTAFQVTKTATGDPNSARISIFNLSPESRAFLEQDNLWVWLQVGYGLTESFTPYQTIFFGNLNRIKAVKRSGDVIMDIEAMDASNNLTTAVVSVGFSAEINNHQILDEVVKQLRVAVGHIEELPLHVNKHGYTKVATAQKILDELTRPQGFTWNIQDGALYIQKIRKTGDLPEMVEEFELTQNTGLLGIPTKIQQRPDLGGGKTMKSISVLNTQPYIEARCLLNPKLRIGSTVKLSWKNITHQAENTNIRLEIQRLDLAGDSHEGVFECRFQGVILA